MQPLDRITNFCAVEHDLPHALVEGMVSHCCVLFLAVSDEPDVDFHRAAFRSYDMCWKAVGEAMTNARVRSCARQIFSEILRHNKHEREAGHVA